LHIDTQHLTVLQDPLHLSNLLFTAQAKHFAPPASAPQPETNSYQYPTSQPPAFKPDAPWQLHYLAFVLKSTVAIAVKVYLF
jgi:hypothetical protein